MSKELTDSIKNATIDELMEILDYCGHDGYYNDLYYPIIEEIKRRLKKQKEQMEIIRCKDCKWHRGQYYCLNIDNWGFHENDFCSYAERREEGGAG